MGQQVLGVKVLRVAPVPPDCPEKEKAILHLGDGKPGQQNRGKHVALHCELAKTNGQRVYAVDPNAKVGIVVTTTRFRKKDKPNPKAKAYHEMGLSYLPPHATIAVNTKRDEERRHQGQKKNTRNALDGDSQAVLGYVEIGKCNAN